MGKIVLGQKPKIVEVIPSTALTESISDLIFTMMYNDPERRITIEQVQDRLKDILFEYSDELLAIPVIEKPKLFDENNEADVAKWRHRVDEAIKFHNMILPQLEELIDKIGQEEKYRKKRRLKQLETVYIWYSGQAPLKHVRIRCSNCQRKLQLPPNMVGKKFRCPNCQQRLVTQLVEET